MEYNFENVTTLNQTMYAEALRKVRKVYTIMPLWMVGMMLYAVYWIWEAYTQYVIALDFIFWFVIYLAGLIYGLLLPKIHAKKALRTMQKQNGGQPVVTTRQFGERINTYNANGVYSLDYYNIKKVYSFKTCYVIRFVDNMAVMILSREGFTKGTFEEFKQFLRYKCPNLEIPE